MANRISKASLLLLAAVAVSSRPAHPESSFEGKQIRVLVPTSSGGTAYGHYANLAVGHFGRFVPGKPTVVVSFMPGAGGLTAMNYLYEVAPRDGTVIAIM